MRLTWQSMEKEQKRAHVQALASENLSAGEIAARTDGATRNAIIGFCHREKIQLKGKSSNSSNVVPLTPKPRQVKKPTTGAEEPEGLVIDLEEVRPLLPRIPRGPMSILDACNGRCRAPLFNECRGVHPDQIMFCGEVTATESNWCREHQKEFTEGKVRVKTVVDDRGEPVKGIVQQRRPTDRWRR